MANPKQFKTLQEKWYRKLEASGFNDIENYKHGSRPLKEWHSFKMTSQRFAIIRAKRASYQSQIDDFLNHPDFKDICRSITAHGNCKFVAEDIETIWVMHTQGFTTRQIAYEMGRVKARIDDVLKKMIQWMNLL